MMGSYFEAHVAKPNSSRKSINKGYFLKNFLKTFNKRRKWGVLRENPLQKGGEDSAKTKKEKASPESSGSHRRSCQTMSKPRGKSNFCL